MSATWSTTGSPRSLSGARRSWSRRPRYLSKEEYLRLYDHMDPDRALRSRKRNGSVWEYVRVGDQWQLAKDAQDLMVVLVFTGGRWSEITALTWDRVDLENGLIRLFGTKTDEERV